MKERRNHERTQVACFLVHSWFLSHCDFAKMKEIWTIKFEIPVPSVPNEWVCYCPEVSATSLRHCTVKSCSSLLAQALTLSPFFSLPASLLPSSPLTWFALFFFFPPFNSQVLNSTCLTHECCCWYSELQSPLTLTWRPHFLCWELSIGVGY